MGIPTEEEFYAALVQRHGEELQAKFSAAKAAVCGLGGLGSNIAISLARAGVGTLHLIDFDRVDISNLNRQQYAVSQIGEMKTNAMKDNLRAIAPYCNVIIDNVRLTEENIPELLRDDEIICEAFDMAEAKAMLVNTVMENFPEKYIIAASGMSGLRSPNGITTRKVTEKLYICGDGTSDVDKDGTLYAPRPMICAAHQATIALQIIAGKIDI